MLTISFSTTVTGSVLFELQDETGKLIPGYSLSDLDELFGDDLEGLLHGKTNPMFPG